MSNIFFTSDLHFCHDRDFIYQPRGFVSVSDMNQAILSRWNATVKPDDDVYVLGDLMLNDNEKGKRLIQQLNGKIHIIRGNHDTDERWKVYKECWNVVEITEAKFFKYKDYHFFLSHYPCLCANEDDDKPLKRRMISLCGHNHTLNKFRDMDKGLIYHVELDAHKCYPVQIEKIIEDITKYIGGKMA